MKRRRKAKSHNHRNKQAGQNDAPISRPMRYWPLGIFLVVCAGVSLVAFVRPSFFGDQAGQSDPRTQGQLPEGLLPFLSGDPEFRPIEATTEQLVREATQMARSLVDRFPNNPVAIDVLAQLHARFGNSAEAVAAWEKCLQLDPSYVAAYDGIGSVAASKQQYEKAAACFRKVIELDPSSGKAPIDLAHVLMSLGKPEEVVAVLEASTDPNRRSMPPFLLLGQAYHQLKQYEKAKKCFEVAVEISPDYPNAHYGLAMAYARLGDADQAKKHRELFSKFEAKHQEGRTRVDEMPDDQLSARQSLAQTYTNAGRLVADHANAQEAEPLWRKAAALDATNTICRENLAALYEQTNRDQEALLLCLELVKIQPANPDYSLNVGLMNARLNQLAAARSAVRRAIQLDPKNRRYQEVYEMIEKGE